MVQTASVAARTRGILRRCAPQDDNYFVILSGTKCSEESRACAFARQSEYTRMARRVVAPYEEENTAQTDSPSGVAASLPTVSAKWAERARNARPYGVAAISLHIATASGRHPQSRTTPLRAQRVLKGKGVIRKRGETAGVSPLVRSAAAQVAPWPVGSGYALRPVGRIRKDGAPRSSRPTEDAAAQAAFPPAMRGQFRNAFQGEYERARDPSLRSG